MDSDVKDVCLSQIPLDIWANVKMASFAKRRTLRDYVVEAIREKLATENLALLKTKKPGKRRYDTSRKVKPHPVEVAEEVAVAAVVEAQVELEGKSPCCGVALTSWLGKGKCVGCGKVWK